MRITCNDARNLGVCIAQPAADKFLNWATGAWEAPFAATAHLKPLTPMEASGSPFYSIQTVDIGTELLSRPDVAAVLVAIDPGAGTPTYTVVDVWTLPATPFPAFGGFTRL